MSSIIFLLQKCFQTLLSAEDRLQWGQLPRLLFPRVAWFWLPREHPPFARCSWCRLFCAFPVSVQQIPLQVWYGHTVSHLRSRLVAFEKSDWVFLFWQCSHPNTFSQVGVHLALPIGFGFNNSSRASSGVFLTGFLDAGI